jgi:hypothetical protein
MVSPPFYSRGSNRGVNLMPRQSLLCFGIHSIVKCDMILKVVRARELIPSHHTGVRELFPKAQLRRFELNEIIG